MLICFEIYRNNRKFIKIPKNKVIAKKSELLNFFIRLELLLSQSGFIKTEDRKNIIICKIRNIFNRMDLTTNEINTLMGIINSLAKKKKNK